MYHLDISDVSFSMLVFVFSFDMIVLEENIKSSVMPTFLTLLKIKKNPHILFRIIGMPVERTRRYFIFLKFHDYILC